MPPVVVTIITAVYNRASTIGDSINSVRSQTWPFIEYIVIDGGSVDGTLDVLESNRDIIDILVTGKDNGIYDALNKGLCLASGEVVGFLHSDDFFAHDRVIEKVADNYSSLGVCGVYGDIDYVAQNDTSRIVRRWRSGKYNRNRLFWGWMPPHPALFLGRGVIESWGGFDTNYRIAADYDAILRYLIKGNIRLAYIPEVLVKMRLGGESNRSLFHIVRKTREDYRVIKRNGVGGVATLVAKNLRKLGQFI